MDHSSGLSSCAMGNASSRVSDAVTPGPDGSDMVASSANSCPSGGNGGDGLRRCNGHLQSTDGPLAILQQAVAQMSNGAGLQPEGQTPAPSTTPPSTPGRLQTCPNQSGSPEIKLRITKTYLDGKPLFESSLCGESTDEADVSLPIPNQQPEVTVGHASTEAARPPTPPGSQGTVTPVEGQLAPDAVAERPSVPSDVEQYHVGDLVWAKIRGHPWWPCMVSHDPKLCIHFQLKEMSKTTSRRYHMQFFGPAAERAWLVERSIVAYKSLEQYDELVAQLARHASSSTERAKIIKPMPPRVKTQWDVAVAEVKEAALLDRKERLETFTFFYFDPKEEKANRQHKKAQSSTKRAAAKIGQAGKQTEHLPPNLQEEPMAAVESVDKLGLRLAEPSTQGEDQAMALFARFCQNQQGLIQQEFPGASPGELQAILSSRWERLSAQEKASFASNHVVSPSGSSQCQSNSPSLPDTAQDSSHHSEELHPRKRRRQDVKSDSSLPLPPGREEMSGKTPARPICKGAVQMSDNCKPLKKRGLASMGTSCSPSDVDEDLAAPGEPSSDLEVCIGAFDAASPEVNEDSQHGGRRIRRDICQVCEKPGDSLVLCEGQCCSVYHMECLALNKTPTGKMLCKECTTGVHPCFACKAIGCGTVRRCMISACGKFYHENCLRDLPSALVDHRGNFRCPMHACLTCQLDCHSKLRVNRGRLVRCVRCPVAYHVSENLRCLAAGSKLLSSTSIVCSSHFTPSKSSRNCSHMNVNWCFLCSRGCLLQTRALFAFSGHYLMNESKHAHVACKLPMIPVVPVAAAKAGGKGGSLLCCESCPATFHLDCLGIEPPDGSWICSDCRLGRKPRYRDIVWVKFGSFRWWPAEICPPRAVPSNIQALRHGIGEFPVRFFGSHDYQYMHQGRVFPYVEGDKGNCNGSTLALNSSFQKALQEAAVRYQELKAEQETREAQEIERNERKPPYYKEIKTNKPVGKVQILTADLSEIPRCSCKATDEGACGLDSECLNRILLYECHPMVCPAGVRCNNQSFSKRLYPPAEVFRASACGWGLRTKVDVRKGLFVNEYVGELVDEEECRKRIKLAHENDVTHFYMLTLAKDRIIDAGPKGNLSRFMNHSCQPNCETQKWSVNGDTRVGLFALCDIKAGTELTFNYNLDCLGNEKTVCKCGADNCSGFLGVRPKTAVAAAVEERIKKVRPKARRSGARFRHEDDCFRCGLSGELVMCGRKGCPKSYHVSCLQLDKPPHGRWDCPWHHCDVCGKASVALCHYCPDSFCKDHQAGALLPTGVEGRLTCARHEEEFEDRSSTDLVNLDTVVADVVESCA